MAASADRGPDLPRETGAVYALTMLVSLLGGLILASAYYASPPSALLVVGLAALVVGGIGHLTLAWVQARRDGMPWWRSLVNSVRSGLRWLVMVIP